MTCRSILKQPQARKGENSASKVFYLFVPFKGRWKRETMRVGKESNVR
jgi:hypothetical protein